MAYWKPKVANLRVERCTSDGTADNFGTYASVNFNWELCQLLGTNNISSIEIAIDDGTPTTVSASGTSGTVSEIVGANALSIDTSYSIKITVTDSESESTSYTRTIPSSSFPIDFLAGGTGVNFGGPAEETGFHSSWAAEFDGKLTANAGAHVTGGFTEDIPIHVSGDCNSLTTTGKYYIGTSGTNKPGSGLNGWLESKKYSTDYCHQTYTTYQGDVYTRMMQAGTWGAWSSVFSISDIFPVNSVVIRYDHISPSTIYGGTWERISDRYLWATNSSGTIGATGGSGSVTLSTSQIPAHTHGWKGYVGTGAFSGSTNVVALFGSSNASSYINNGKGPQSIGGGGSHTNHAQYIQVSVWRRTA